MNKLSDLIAELERDRSLGESASWRQRIDALDRLESCLIHADGDMSENIKKRAEQINAVLEADNQMFYESLRQDIKSGCGAQRLMQCVSELLDKHGDATKHEGYDDLDTLISGILPLQEPTDDVAALEPEMVFYQPTPARQIFHFLRRAALDETDILIDLGAGLGHVALLAAICSEARCIGIERDAAYVASAIRCAAELGLERASFLSCDVRDADFSQGTVFYLYTPFTGALLAEVLAKLKHEATRRAIRIGTLGPCTAIIAREGWLKAAQKPSSDNVGMFHSH
jgi:hypothetical protein